MGTEMDLDEFLIRLLMEHGLDWWGAYWGTRDVESSIHYFKGRPPSGSTWTQKPDDSGYVHLTEDKTKKVIVEYNPHTRCYQLTPYALELIQKGNKQ